MKKLRSLFIAAAFAFGAAMTASMPVMAEEIGSIVGAPADAGSTGDSHGEAEALQKTEDQGFVPALPAEEEEADNSAGITSAPVEKNETVLSAPQDSSVGNAPTETEAEPPKETEAQVEKPAETSAPKEVEKPAETSALKEVETSAETEAPKEAEKVEIRPASADDSQDDEADTSGPGFKMLTPGGGVSEPTVGGGYKGGSAPATDWSKVSGLRKEIVEYAKQFEGCDYVYGGTTPDGFDCSGFIMYVMKNVANVSLYHQSAVQATTGKGVSAAEMRPGDIIAYDGSQKDGLVNHVSLYIGDGKAIHAVGTGKGVRITAWDYETPFAIRNVLGD